MATDTITTGIHDDTTATSAPVELDAFIYLFNILTSI